MKRKLSGYGWLDLVIGILLILLGIMTLMRPGRTFTWLVILYGVIAIVTGISDIIFYMKAAQFTGFGPTISLITGILSILAGATLLVYPGLGTTILLILLPIWFITHSISRLSHLNIVRFTAGNGYYYFTLIVNILGIVLGFLMIIKPSLSFIATGFIIGAYLILTGIDMIIVAASDIGHRW